jgi:TatD DNase family protein
VHDRDAHEDCINIIKKTNAKEVGGIFHCFSGSREMAVEVLKQNFYIAVGGVVTFKNVRKTVEVVKDIPLDRLLIETDCPYLAPEPNRGKRNHSGNLIYVIRKIAEIKGLSEEQVAVETFRNAMKVFDIKD